MLSSPLGAFPYPEGTDPITDYPAVAASLAARLDAVVPLLGWIPLTGAFAYSSADSPVFVMTTPSDLRASVGVGMRIKLTQTTVKYFIVVAIDATTITLYGGTDYTLANAAISNVYCSAAKAPIGFPLDPTKWTVSLKDTSDRTQASPSAGTWYNLGTLSLAIPIGAWRVGYSCEAQETASSDSNTQVATTLSTANNSETDTDFTAQSVVVMGSSGSWQVIGAHYREKSLVLAAKTTYYLNVKTGGIGSQIGLIGTRAPSIIRAVCAYL